MDAISAALIWPSGAPLEPLLAVWASRARTPARCRRC
jgi:hypothetical protein